MTYQMTINGKKRSVAVADYAAASAHFLSEQVRIGYRSPNDRTVYPRSAELFSNGVQVAYVSQNGKVWAGTEWEPDSDPLYVPN